LFIYRLTIGSDFGSNYWNRPDSTISTLGIDLKFELIPIILRSIQLDSSRYSISILGIESNCQKIENYVIMSRITNFRMIFLLIKYNICIYRLYKFYRYNLLIKYIICIYRIYRIYRCNLIIFFLKSSNALL